MVRAQPRVLFQRHSMNIGSASRVDNHVTVDTAQKHQFHQAAYLFFGNPWNPNNKAMRLAGLARPAGTCLRPSQISRQLLVLYRLPPRRHISSDHGAPRSIAKFLEWKPQAEVRDVVVNGFIRSVRSMKARSFVALGDGSSLAPLQAIVPTDQAEGYDQNLRCVCLGYLYQY